MSSRSLPCPACVTWVCSTCGHRRNRMNASWVNPSCARCGGTTGLRLAVRHRPGSWIESDHREVDQTPRETIREDGCVFRWPAPFLDQVPKPGIRLIAPDVPPLEPKHPDGTCATPHLLGRSFEALAYLVAADVAKATKAGTVTWSELLLVRVLNALSVRDPETIRYELSRVRELIEEWTEELDRRIG